MTSEEIDNADTSFQVYSIHQAAENLGCDVKQIFGLASKGQITVWVPVPPTHTVFLIRPGSLQAEKREDIKFLALSQGNCSSLYLKDKLLEDNFGRALVQSPNSKYFLASKAFLISTNRILVRHRRRFDLHVSGNFFRIFKNECTPENVSFPPEATFVSKQIFFQGLSPCSKVFPLNPESQATCKTEEKYNLLYLTDKEMEKIKKILDQQEDTELKTPDRNPTLEFYQRALSEEYDQGSKELSTPDQYFITNQQALDIIRQVFSHPTPFDNLKLLLEVNKMFWGIYHQENLPSDETAKIKEIFREKGVALYLAETAEKIICPTYEKLKNPDKRRQEFEKFHKAGFLSDKLRVVLVVSQKWLALTSEDMQKPEAIPSNMSMIEHIRKIDEKFGTKLAEHTATLIRPADAVPAKKTSPFSYVLK